MGEDGEERRESQPSAQPEEPAQPREAVQPEAKPEAKGRSWKHWNPKNSRDGSKWFRDSKVENHEAKKESPALAVAKQHFKQQKRQRKVRFRGGSLIPYFSPTLLEAPGERQLAFGGVVPEDVLEEARWQQKKLADLNQPDVRVNRSKRQKQWHDWGSSGGSQPTENCREAVARLQKEWKEGTYKKKFPDIPRIGTEMRLGPPRTWDHDRDPPSPYVMLDNIRDHLQYRNPQAYQAQVHEFTPERFLPGATELSQQRAPASEALPMKERQEEEPMSIPRGASWEGSVFGGLFAGTASAPPPFLPCLPQQRTMDDLREAVPDSVAAAVHDPQAPGRPVLNFGGAFCRPSSPEMMPESPSELEMPDPPMILDPANPEGLHVPQDPTATAEAKVEASEDPTAPAEADLPEGSKDAPVEDNLPEGSTAPAEADLPEGSKDAPVEDNLPEGSTAPAQADLPEGSKDAPVEDNLPEGSTAPAEADLPEGSKDAPVEDNLPEGSTAPAEADLPEGSKDAPVEDNLPEGSTAPAEADLPEGSKDTPVEDNLPEDSTAPVQDDFLPVQPEEFGLPADAAAFVALMTGQEQGERGGVSVPRTPTLFLPQPVQLTPEQKQRIWNRMNRYERHWVWSEMTHDQRLYAFRQLPVRKKKIAWKLLGHGLRKMLFEALTEEEKACMFSQVPTDPEDRKEMDPFLHYDSAGILPLPVSEIHRRAPRDPIYLYEDPPTWPKFGSWGRGILPSAAQMREWKLPLQCYKNSGDENNTAECLWEVQEDLPHEWLLEEQWQPVGAQKRSRYQSEIDQETAIQERRQKKASEAQHQQKDAQTQQKRQEEQKELEKKEDEQFEGLLRKMEQSQGDTIDQDGVLLKD